MRNLFFFLFVLTLAFPAYPYIGPGMGGGLLAAIIGFIAAIFLGIFGILYYPIKRFFKKNRDSKESKQKK